MKPDWIETSISEVAAVHSGSGFPDRYQGQTGRLIPFYKVSDMNLPGNELEMFNENNSITEEARCELGAFLFPKGSTIFPKIGGAIATNKKRLTTRPCCVDNNVMGVVPRLGKIDSQFLFYFFIKHDLSDFANEAHLPSIKKTVVESWPIALPASLSEQRRVVAILDEAFEAIATAKKNAEQNLQNARSALDAVRQDAFTRLAGSCDSVRLGAVCAFENGDRGKNYPGKQHRVAHGVPFINAGHLTEEGIDFGSMDYISPDRFALLGNGKIRPDDILFCLRGSLGKFASVGDLAAGAIASSLVILRPGKTLAHNYLAAYLSSRQCADMIHRFKGGAAQPNLGATDLKKFELPLPPLPVQHEEATRLDEFQVHTLSLEGIYSAKLAALDELKKSLLHQAFTGALAAKSKDRQLEAVA